MYAKIAGHAKEAEVIEIRGIRGSLGRAMDAKREAGGVVGEPKRFLFRVVKRY